MDGSFMSEQKVLNGREGTDKKSAPEYPRPSESPSSPILFTIYLSGLFGYVETGVPGVKVLSFVDDVVWLVEDGYEDTLSASLEEAAKAAQEWAEENVVTRTEPSIPRKPNPLS